MTRPEKRRATLVFGAAAAILLAAGLTAWQANQKIERPPLLPQDRKTVADGEDPGATGCSYYQLAVQSLDRKPLHTPDGRQLGTAVLRHSPTCRASWGRFEPAKHLDAPVRVTITAERPATGTVGAPATPAFDGANAGGSMLLDTTGCVQVTIRVETAAGAGEATTGCVRGKY
jgi:hypothetical protein